MDEQPGFRTTAECWADKDLDALLERAGMGRHDFNTGVVMSTDDVARVAVRSSAGLPWGDCIGFELMVEGQRTWLPMAFSPARTRILAHLLLRAADHREASDPGMAIIDKKASSP